jgi:nucleoside phosphorylase
VSTWSWTSAPPVPRARPRRVHELATLLEHDFDAAGLEALLDRPVPARVELTAAPASDLTLATGDRFLTDPVAVEHLRRRGVHLVDMEAAALAAACRHHAVAFRAVKYVSDMADADAFRSWRSSVAEASRQLGAWLATHRTGPVPPGA